MLKRRGNQHATAIQCSVGSVGHQVDESGLQLQRVGTEQGQAGRECSLDRDPGRAGAAQAGQPLMDLLVDVQRLADQGLAGAEGQQLPGQERSPVGGRLCHGQQLGRAGVAAQAHRQQVQRVADRGQQVVELMRQAAAEPAYGLELLGLAQGALGITQQALGLPLLGDVAGDLDEAQQLAVLADRFDDDAGSERRAIMAHPPALSSHVAILCGQVQQALRLAGLAFIGQVEAAEVGADDFVGTVALDPLGARVPAADDAVRIKQVQGMVTNAVDQQSQLSGRVRQHGRRRGKSVHLEISNTPVGAETVGRPV